ncbi:MAG: D-glycero-alpha-D-manno-heptose-1,7-bisphosphate 7-phosphatase [bacterium]
MTVQNNVIFLDRDGTINVEDGYITKIEQLHLYKETITALKILKELGYKLVIVSNQAGVAKGLLTEATLVEINKALLSMLLQENIFIDGLYYCPHHPEAVIPEYKKDCECRKPKIGMIKRAERELNINAKGAYMIGDKLTDIELAYNFGGRGILLLTGYGEEEVKKINSPRHTPLYVAKDILDAVEWIKKQSK